MFRPPERGPGKGEVGGPDLTHPREFLKCGLILLRRPPPSAIPFREWQNMPALASIYQSQLVIVQKDQGGPFWDYGFQICNQCAHRGIPVRRPGYTQRWRVRDR